MKPSSTEITFDPSIYGAEQETTCPGGFLKRWRMLKDISEFGGREVAVQQKARSLTQLLLINLLGQGLADRHASLILPDDRGGQGLAGLSIPEQESFSLVVQPHGSYWVGLKQREDSLPNRLKDLPGILLDPPRLRKRDGDRHRALIH
jgi:hypothetical protein